MNTITIALIITCCLLALFAGYYIRKEIKALKDEKRDLILSKTTFKREKYYADKD